MHHNHMSPALIRARLRRAVDPCMLRQARLYRDGEALAELTVWYYRKASFSASLAMALSGVVGGSGESERALVLSEISDSTMPGPGDALVFSDTADSFDVLHAAPWPDAGTPAVVTLTLRRHTS